MGTPRSQHFDPVTTILGPQTPINLDHVAPSTAFVGVYSTGGAPDYVVEMTADDVNDASIEPRWFTLTLDNVGPSGARWTHIIFPMSFVRLNITSFTQPIEFKVLQTSDALRC